MTLKIMNNLFDDLLTVFQKLHPEKTNVIIQFDPSKRNKTKKGYILIPEKDGPLEDYYIYISSLISVEDAVTELAHQLTDLVVNVDKDHNDFLWKKTFNTLMDLAELETKNRYENSKLNSDDFEVYDE